MSLTTSRGAATVGQVSRDTNLSALRGHILFRTSFSEPLFFSSPSLPTTMRHPSYPQLL